MQNDACIFPDGVIFFSLLRFISNIFEFIFIFFFFFQEYVEPFIYVHRKADSELYNPMSLHKVQARLKANGYNHPMEFADDVRRIITETYRYCAPKDPLIELAGKLQSEFEMMFAKIEFHVSEPLFSLFFVISFLHFFFL